MHGHAGLLHSLKVKVTAAIARMDCTQRSRNFCLFSWLQHSFAGGAVPSNRALPLPRLASLAVRCAACRAVVSQPPCCLHVREAGRGNIDRATAGAEYYDACNLVAWSLALCTENCAAAKSQVVDPWNVQAGADGAIDYDRLVREVRHSHGAAKMSAGRYVQRPQQL